MSDDEKRDFRRIQSRKFRTITVKGHHNRKYGETKRITTSAENTSQKFRAQPTPVIAAPVIKIDLPKPLRAELYADDILIKIGKQGIESPIFTIQGKDRTKFNNYGIIAEKEYPNGDFVLTTYDVLYGYQLGILGMSKKSRPETFKAICDFMIRNDPEFLKKYVTYSELRKKNYIVLDGLKYGTTFAIFEQMPPNIIKEIESTKDPDMVGIGGKSKISIQSTALVDVVTDDMSMKELIKGQHLAKRSDMRYLIAKVDDFTDDEGNMLSGGNVSIYLLRKDRFKITSSDNRALIINNVGPFEFKEE